MIPQAPPGGPQGTFPPPTPKSKKLLKKNGVISEGSIFATTFLKLAKNSIFLLNFYKNFQKFLNVSQQFVFFVQTAKNEHIGLLNFLKNMLKQWIFCNFIQKSFGKFRKFLRISHRFVFFVQTAKNQRIGLLIFNEKYPKIMHFQQFS